MELKRTQKPNSISLKLKKRDPVTGEYQFNIVASPKQKYREELLARLLSRKPISR
jgi:hypothetical protein